jgi:hypothetical protein
MITTINGLQIEFNDFPIRRVGKKPSFSKMLSASDGRYVIAGG